MGGRWPYSWCLVGCCRQNLINIARSILVKFPSSFFSSRLVSVQVVHPYSSIDTPAAWKKLGNIFGEGEGERKRERESFSMKENDIYIYCLLSCEYSWKKSEFISSTPCYEWIVGQNGTSASVSNQPRRRKNPDPNQQYSLTLSHILSIEEGYEYFQWKVKLINLCWIHETLNSTCKSQRKNITFIWDFCFKILCR